MVESDNDHPQRQRALLLFFERWMEQLETSFAPRRARTLGAISALDELVALAEGFVRSGGQTRPAIDPDDAGHGVLMLPDVAQEAVAILSAILQPLRREYVRSAFRVASSLIQDSPKSHQAIVAVVGPECGRPPAPVAGARIGGAPRLLLGQTGAANA